MNAQMHGEEAIEPCMRALDACPWPLKKPHHPVIIALRRLLKRRRGGLPEKAKKGAGYRRLGFRPLIAF
jgi:hypothetical protein